VHLKKVHQALRSPFPTRRIKDQSFFLEQKPLWLARLSSLSAFIHALALNDFIVIA